MCYHPQCPYSQKIDKFDQWLRDSQKLILIVEYEDEEGNLIRKALPKRIRFSESYIKRLRFKFYDIIPDLIEKHSIMFFLTLTVSPSWDLIHTIDIVSKRWHKLLDVLRKRLKKQGIELDYIKVYEPTEKGIIHVHVVLFLTKFPMKDSKVFLIDKKELDELWGLGYTWLGWEENGHKMIWLPLKHSGNRNVKKALAYIFKYISKAHHNVLFASLIWKQGKGGGKRSWTASRWISELISGDVIPKNAVVVFYGDVDNIPDADFPLWFNGDLIQNVDELRKALAKWWVDHG